MSPYNVLPSTMVAIKKLDVSKKSSGEIEQGSVLVECRLIPGSLRYNGNRWGTARCTLDKDIWPSLTEVPIDQESHLKAYGSFDVGSCEVKLDDPSAPCYGVNQAVHIELLLLLRFDSEDYPMVLKGICIVHSSNQPSAFERIGSFTIGREPARLVLAAYEKGWVQNISLV
jgi:hypothetical protein